MHGREEAVGETAPGRRGREDLRTHNLSIVLRAVHRLRQLSRSDLTAFTGLNRSTILSLVAELVERGLVEESEPEATLRAGRPSPIVKPDPRPIAFAVNPEIDAITVSAVGLAGRTHRTERIMLSAAPTPDTAVAIIRDTIRRMRGELEPGTEVVGVGVAVPGLVRAADGMVRLAPHLAWTDVPLGSQLQAETGLAVSLANDAHLGSIAESIFGAGAGQDDVLYVNGGASGIGGGIFAAGAALTGSGGYAGEIGHSLVNSDGRSCHCGAVGCLETEVRRERLLRVLNLEDADAGALEKALLTADDPHVDAEVTRQLKFLAIALRNAVNLLNPQTIILGGFLRSLLLRAPDELTGAVLGSSLAASAENLRIRHSALGADILAIGAAELAFAPLLASPSGYRVSSPFSFSASQKKEPLLDR